MRYSTPSTPIFVALSIYTTLTTAFPTTTTSAHFFPNTTTQPCAKITVLDTGNQYTLNNTLSTCTRIASLSTSDAGQQYTSIHVEEPCICRFWAWTSEAAEQCREGDVCYTFYGSASPVPQYGVFELGGYKCWNRKNVTST